LPCKDKVESPIILQSFPDGKSVTESVENLQHLELNDRAHLLLKLLIRRYVSDGEPVGSRTLSREPGLDLSAATVRNVMADLEDLGLIRAPHTSAGRVPTQLGYRVFVNSLLQVQTPGRSNSREIVDALAGAKDADELLESASELLSDITQYAGVIMLPGSDKAKLRQVEFLELSEDRVLAILVTDDGRVQNRVIFLDKTLSAAELVEAANFFNSRHAGRTLQEVRHRLLLDMHRDSDEMNRMMRTAVEMASQLLDDEPAEEGVVVSGETKLLGIPDFDQLGKLREIFDTFKTKQDLLSLLDKSMRASGISIFIGEESGYSALTDCSVVTAPYESEGRCIGVIGVIGPTRMAYEEVIPVVDITARVLGSALRGLH
jgi:heat-inducible transcriptional repressor|tara:strand:- start:2691 stop:3815 length:1125 start_codon:yes stop_codon:yes gene_type:complete